MPLTSDNDANVVQLMTWLRNPAASTDAVNLREELAYLLFYGDPTWANNEDSSSISDYRSILAEWLKDDGPAESMFVQLTTPGDDSDSAAQLFTTWFAPIVESWKTAAKTTESGDRGHENPNFGSDPTPGTEFYWYDPSNEVYLYASTADAPDNEWLSYEERRYTPVQYDDARRTNYRQDRVTSEYEFQSRVTAAKWLTSAEWETEVAASAAPASAGAEADQPLYTAPVYDAGFEMYRRFNSSSRQYEYADDMASVAWLSVEQATALRVQQQAAQGARTAEVAQQAYSGLIAPSLEEIVNSGHPAVQAVLAQEDGPAKLRDEVMRAAANLLAARAQTPA